MVLGMVARASHFARLMDLLVSHGWMRVKGVHFVKGRLPLNWL